MSKSIIILAAGHQFRWGRRPIKQLLPIGNTTIIERTVNQCFKRGYKPIVITHRPELRVLPAQLFMPYLHRYTSETLFYSASFFDEQTIVLLGDVIYSHNVMDMIFNCQDRFRAFGNQWEVFALSFQVEKSSVIDALIDTIKLAELGQLKGTLRDFFRVYTNTDEDDTNHKYFERICHFNDYTNDIDTPEEYENFLQQHLTAMEYDDFK